MADHPLLEPGSYLPLESGSALPLESRSFAGPGALVVAIAGPGSSSPPPRGFFVYQIPLYVSAGVPQAVPVASEVHVGDVGLVFLATIHDDAGVVDLSTASAVRFLFQKPDASPLAVAASAGSDGSDGQFSYSTVDGDLDQPGTWRLQAFIAVGISEKYTDIVKFKVKPNLPLGV